MLVETTASIKASDSKPKRENSSRHLFSLNEIPSGMPAAPQHRRARLIKLNASIGCYGAFCT
jgi:hypothetical protein